MITGIPGMMLNSLSILVMSAVFVFALISLIFYCYAIPLQRFSADARQTALWLLVGSPWLTGFIASFITMSLSNPIIANYTGNRFIHWHHPSTFTLTSWHSYFVLSMLGLAAFLLLKTTLRLIRARTTIRILQSLASPETDGVHILDTDIAAAFTAGLTHPGCYMTSALVKQLNQDEYAIIRLHELAHARRRDPMRKTLFHLLTAAFPTGIAQTLNQTMITAIEQSADAAVSNAYPDKTLIARTLVKARRLSVQCLPNSLFPTQACHYSVDNIDQRIHYLLTNQKGRAVPMLLVCTLIATLSMVFALGVDSVHHAIEVSLHHF